MSEVDRILDNIDLDLERRRDVDGRVGDDQRIGMTGNIHDKAMTDATRRANPAISGDHRPHDFVGVEAALHQRFRSPIADEFHAFPRRILTVVGVDNFETGDVDLKGFRRVQDSRSRADQSGDDQT